MAEGEERICQRYNALSSSKFPWYVTEEFADREKLLQLERNYFPDT